MVLSVIGTQPNVSATGASGIFQLNEIFGYIAQGIWPTAVLSSLLSYSQQILLDGPVAYWRLGESSGTTATDEIGSHNGTYAGSPTLGQAGAIVNDDNTAINLNGSSQYVQISDDPELDINNQDFCVEFWYKTTSTSTMRAVSKRGSGGAGTVPSWQISGTGGSNWDNTIIDAGDGTYISFGSTTVSVNNDGNWHHFVMTYDNSSGTGKIYQDGSLGDTVTAGAVAGKDLSNALPVYIGRADNGTQYWNGLIDEVSIYDTALSSTQIRRHYYRGLGYTGYELEVLSSGPVSYWRLGESSGTTAVDEIGNYDGTYNGSPALGATGLITGVADTAVDFDGTNDEVVITGFSPSNPITLEAWINPDTIPVTFGSHIINMTASTGDNLAITLDTDGTIFCNVYDSSAGTNLIAFNGSTTLSTGQTYHIVGTFDGDELILYVDGAVDGSGLGGTNFDEGTGYEVTIGNHVSAARWFDGTIDEAAIYDTVLSSTQIRRHYYRGLGYTGYELEVLASGPIGYWRLGESSGTTATDETGNHDGTYNGSPTFGVSGAISGDADTAVGFDGSDDDVTVPDGAELDFTSDMTLEVWVKVNNYASGLVIAAKRDNSNYAWELAVDNGSGAFLARVNANANVATSTTLATDNTVWHHVVMTYDQSNIKVYVDGDLEDSYAYSTAITTNSVQVTIGSRGEYSGAEAWFDGVIDEVAIYDTALSPTDITRHYNAGVGV
jgi:hypothetical protein